MRDNNTNYNNGKTMETQKFCFEATINGQPKDLIVEAPVKDGCVYTNKFCPQELLTGGLSFVTAINGESLEEFISDCQKQVLGIHAAGKTDSSLDAHIGGLMGVVMEHLSRCGRLIFGDLLIYMDCFSLLLEADGFSETEIRKAYIKLTRTIVEIYPEYIFNTFDLSPFKGSLFDTILFNIEHEKL